MRLVKEVTNKKVWEQFMTKNRGVVTPFFQSWNWGEVQARLGNKIFRLGLFDGKKILGICLVVLIKAKRGTYLHLRHGPVVEKASDIESLVGEVKKIAKKERAYFIRLSPLIPSDAKERLVLSTLKTRNSPIHNMDAENASMLNLERPEEQIMSDMRKTTRYLVRKAQKLPIEIKKTAETKDFKNFLNLYEETSRRHNFVPHRGMEEELEIFSKDDEALLYLAYFNKKLIAGAIIIFYGNQAVYHHGASSEEFKEVPAAYILQWQAILDAKKRGKKYYNFWGVVPPDRPNHPWKGITLFKTGFGGSNINFVHSQDIPLSLGYWKTYLIESFWRIRKGY